MSNSAPRAANGTRRRRLAILWGIIAGFIILVLLLLGFCTSNPPKNSLSDPGAPSSAVSRTTAPSTAVPASRPAAGPSGPSAGPAQAGVRPTDPTTRPTTRPATSRTAKPAVAPKGGPDTGGGSSAPSGVVLFAVGLVALLAAVGATVQAFRPRGSRR